MPITKLIFVRKAAVIVAAIALLASVTPAFAQPDAGFREKVRGWVQGEQKRLIQELRDLLAIPNVAADRENVRSRCFTRRGRTSLLGVRR